MEITLPYNDHITAVIRHQKDGTLKTVHVNNLSYANINKNGTIINPQRKSRKNFQNKTPSEHLFLNVDNLIELRYLFL